MIEHPNVEDVTHLFAQCGATSPEEPPDLPPPPGERAVAASHARKMTIEWFDEARGLDRFHEREQRKH